MSAGRVQVIVVVISVSASLQVLAIQQMTDPDVLSRWLDSAVEATSLEVFRGVTQADLAAPPAELPYWLRARARR